MADRCANPDRKIRESSVAAELGASSIANGRLFMTAREFVTNATIILTIMAIGALIETAVPMFVARPCARGRRGANLGLTALSFLSNWLLASVAAMAAVSLRPTGLLARLGWPMGLDIVAGIVVLDFSIGYLSHRTMHAWPAMWRFHRVHHSDAFVDVTTTYRTHPVETAWRFLFGIIPIWILGIPAPAVVIQRLLQAANGVIEHGNIRLWPPLDRALSWVWVTPNVHKIHHSREMSETNSNYANLLTIYDRLLGTYTPSTRAESVVYGLDNAEGMSTASCPVLVAMPFQRSAPSEPHDTKVRLEAGAGR
jgi:sterol desaturase/sphingolipid hydroxylase (fatty acid hydroxylase superfamily)